MEHLPGERPPGEAEVDRDQPVSEGETAPHGQGEEPSFDVDHVETGGAETITEGGVGVDGPMGVVVEVGAGGEGEVRLDQEKVPTRSEHLAHPGQAPVDRVVLEVFEEVAGHHRVELAGAEAREIGRVADHRLDTVGHQFIEGGMQIDRDPAPGIDRRAPLPASGSQVEHRSFGVDPPREVRRDVLPDRGSPGIVGESRGEVGGLFHIRTVPLVAGPGVDLRSSDSGRPHDRGPSEHLARTAVDGGAGDRQSQEATPVQIVGLGQLVGELEQVVLEGRADMVAAVPGDDEGGTGEDAGEGGLGERLDMAAVDESSSRCRKGAVAVDGGLVEGETGERRREVDVVAQRVDADLARCPVGPGQTGEIP